MTDHSAIIPLRRKPFVLMGIINVTPDSFYDGGRYLSAEAAVNHGLKLLDEGADILDIGGASSRPGASMVDPQEECRRVVPVIEALARRCGAPLSVDTTWSAVAQNALDAGASIINDISAGRFDKGMISLAARSGCDVVLMHSRGTADSMHSAPSYDNVVEEVCSEVFIRVSAFVNEGVAREKIVLDPGIGFSKNADQSIELLRHVDSFVNLGYPVMIGTSRKSFIERITAEHVEDRLWGSLASVASAFLRGVSIFRVHDIRATRDFLKVLSAIEDRQLR